MFCDIRFLTIVKFRDILNKNKSTMLKNLAKIISAPVGTFFIFVFRVIKRNQIKLIVSLLVTIIAWVCSFDTGILKLREFLGKITNYYVYSFYYYLIIFSILVTILGIITKLYNWNNPKNKNEIEESKKEENRKIEKIEYHG